MNFQHGTANHALSYARIYERNIRFFHEISRPKNTHCCSKLLAVAYKRPGLEVRSEDTEHVTGTGRKNNGKFEVFTEINIHSEVV